MKNILIKGLFVSVSILLVTSSVSALDCSDPNTSCSAVGSIQLSARVCVDLPKTLSKGMESSSVLALQNFLVSKGFLKVKPNSYYGQGTKGAVIKYQKSVGIPQVGIVGPSTRKSIKKDTCTVTVTPDIKSPKISYQIDPTQPVSSQKIDNTRYDSAGVELSYDPSLWYLKGSALLSLEKEDSETPKEIKTGNEDSAKFLIVRETYPFENVVGEVEKYKNCTEGRMPGDDPGELHVIKAKDTTIYECVTSTTVYPMKNYSVEGKEKIEVSFIFQHPITKNYIVYKVESSLSLINQRAKILKEFEDVITRIKFFQPKVVSGVYTGEGPDSSIGNNANIIKGLSAIQTQAKTYYDSNGKTYTGFCDNADIKAKIYNIRILTPYPMECNSSSNQYAISSHMLDYTNYWCIDSTGFASTSASTLEKKTVCKK